MVIPIHRRKSDQAIVVLIAPETGRERRVWVIQLHIHYNNFVSVGWLGRRRINT